MKWRKPETRREKRERIQAEKGAPARADKALITERDRFTLWCEDAEKTILRDPDSSLAREKANQLLLAAQHKYNVFPNPGLPVGPENGWKTQDSGENLQRASQASYHLIRGCFPGLSDAIILLREGKGVDIAPLVAYLEAAPRFYGSGYLAETCIGYVLRARLTTAQKASLQAAALKAVDNQDRFRIKDYCRLARAVDSPELRSLLQARLSGEDPVVRRRAEIMLHSLTEKDAGR